MTSTAVTAKARTWKVAAIDLAERAGSTFAQAALAAEFANHGRADVKLGLYAGAFAVGKWALLKANTYLSTLQARAQG